MSEETYGFRLEDVLRRIEAGNAVFGDDVIVARRCRERGSKLAAWCEENAKLRAEIARLREENETLRDHWPTFWKPLPPLPPRPEEVAE